MPGTMAGIPGIQAGTHGILAGIPGIVVSIPGILACIPGIMAGIPGIMAGILAGIPGILASIITIFFAMSKKVCTFAPAMEQKKKINWKTVLTVAIAILGAILGAIGENATNCIGTILNL